jgi:hypothetical protein
MLRATVAALLLLAACGSTEPYHCAATVSGTGTAADGVYSCSVPARGVYTPATRAGLIQGNAFSTNGHEFSFNISMDGQPAAMTYNDVTLPAGGAYDVEISGPDSAPLWGATTGSNSFELHLTSLNTESVVINSAAWPTLTGTLTATLKPVQGNTAKTNATVTMIF